MKVLAFDKDETLIHCIVECTSVKAICVLDSKRNKIWLPKSQIEVVSENHSNYEILMPNWLAEEKEII